MGALARYIMRGRIQAVTIALLGSWVPLISQAALGLVTLRKGWQEGLIVTMWAMLPALAGLWLGNVGIAVAYASVAVILVGYALAIVLRVSVSWPVTLASTVVLSILTALGILWLAPDLVGEIQSFFKALLVDPEAPEGSEAENIIVQFTATKASGMVAFWVGVSSIGGLLIGRWMQAIVYNPGGFQQEFHLLRLNPQVALACLAGIAYCLWSGAEYSFWANLFSLPLALAGLGLVHHAIASWGGGVAAVLAMYLVLIIFGPTGIVVSLLGFTDVWLNYRERFNLKQPK